MLRTKICELFGIELPIVSAGMGGVAYARLAAAVSEAGGLGTLALSGLSREAMAQELALARGLTKKPLAVNLLAPFLRPGMIEAVGKEQIPALTLFWGDPLELIPQVKRAGMLAIWQCGSASEALAAQKAGADAILAQGFEAGGHVRGAVATLALIPRMRDALGPAMPLLAAGGMADGRGLAAALALGADGAVFGTRFLATPECAAHPAYKRAILAGEAEDTLFSTLFDVGWPNATHRVLRNRQVAEWERAGRPASGHRPGEGEPAGRLRAAGSEVPLVKYSVMTPNEDFEGDVESLPFYAGHSVGLVGQIKPAGEIVREIAAEAREVIRGRLAELAR